ncbi:anti-repressor SinI family protein [Halobacillus amylolyticus]|uniref:Anti-repressor SinI family protein n=1 Tax=Halobacillus amylolyticus TaxID=2932259 RepID=A0ABY4H9V0_9BACI|nr:anti-repressor SinI family protein [Halobacillus amylolyticus]UOR11634.1 anti-repressor SinI family protein [Halobacillus amylolyticus]
MMGTLPETRTLDAEWVSLMEEAKAMGLSKEQVEAFIQQAEKEK